MRRFLFVSFVVAALGGVLFFITPGHADTGDTIEVLNQKIADNKDKIAQLQKTINTYNDAITQADTQTVSLKNQLSILNNHINVVSSTAQLTGAEIDVNKAELDELAFSINEKVAAIGEQRLLISNLINTISADEQKNNLEVMLSYKTFGEFYDELKNSQSIYLDLGRSLQALRLAETDLTNSQAAVQPKQTTLLTFQTQLQANQQDLNDEIAYRQSLLAQTQNSEKKYQTLLSSLKEQYQVIETQEMTFEQQAKKKLEAQNQIAQSGSVDMIWPVPSHIINATFHDPSYPFGNVFAHSGIDIKASQGTAVHAAASGYVAQAHLCTTASCYAYVLIVHNGSISTLYGHLSQILVTDDQFVNQGDVIGYSGATPGTVGAGPFTTGAHLHFEVRLNGIPVNPVPYLP